MKKTSKPFNKKDVYGILGDRLEVDSDVNEDQNREELLDTSFGEFMEEVNPEVKRLF